MPWFRVDDGFPEHPKLEALEARPRTYMAAITVWAIMGPTCSRRETDGVVTKHLLNKTLSAIGKAGAEGAAALVECGLWEIHPEGWKFHDWEKYQPTKASLSASRELKSARQRRWRSTDVDASTTQSISASQTPSTDASQAKLARAGAGPGRDLVSGSASDPESDRVEESGTALDWRNAFAAAWCKKHGQIAYGKGEADARATARLGERLAILTAEQRESVWQTRAHILAAFFMLGATEPKIARAGFQFAFFVERFDALAFKPASAVPAHRPLPPSAPAPSAWPEDQNGFGAMAAALEPKGGP